MARKLTWILMASALLNVLLIGVLLGNLFSHRFHHRPPPPPHHGRLEDLAPESARLLDAAMENVHDKNRALRNDFRQTRMEIFEALAAPEFDREVYLTRVQRLHDLHGQRVFNMAMALADVAPQLTPEERSTLAQQLQLEQRPPPPRP